MSISQSVSHCYTRLKETGVAPANRMPVITRVNEGLVVSRSQYSGSRGEQFKD
jgi:hypothetical protein